jgi:hypothetical protein
MACSKLRRNREGMRMPTKPLADNPGFTNSRHPELSALRINGPAQWKAIVIKAIHANHGVLLDAAEALEVSRSTLQSWVNHYGELAAALQEARDKASDAKAGDRT